MSVEAARVGEYLAVCQHLSITDASAAQQCHHKLSHLVLSSKLAQGLAWAEMSLLGREHASQVEWRVVAQCCCTASTPSQSPRGCVCPPVAVRTVFYGRYGQSAPFTCHPCLKRSTSLVLYVSAFIAALLMVRLLTWLTVLDNNASATAAAAMPQTAKAPKDPNAQAAASSAGGRIKVWAQGLLQRLSHGRGSSSSDVDGSCKVESQLPQGAWSASSNSSGPGAAFTSGAAASTLPPTSSGAVAKSVAAASGGLASATSVSSQASGGAAASYLARASDIFRVLVLYIQVRSVLELLNAMHDSIV